VTFSIPLLDYRRLWGLPLTADELASQDVGEKVYPCPTRFGQGSLRHIYLPRMRIELHNYHFHEDVVLAVTSDGELAPPEIGFQIAGQRSGKSKGQSFIEWGFEEVGTCLISAQSPIQKVDIHLDSFEPLQRLVAAEESLFPPELRPLAAGDITDYGDIRYSTPAMAVCLQQILDCAMPPGPRQLYLEGKCLELIALKLEQISASAGHRPTRVLLSADDIDRLHQAQKVLVDRIAHPPSLIELAHQVGLNDHKLKAGFRQVFDTTVFGFLRQQRMVRSHHLLSEGHMNIKEVAQAVGYSSQSRFAAAFRQQFGVNPHTYLSSKRSG
jgi:AraC family transcriptional regulator, transcriptional activator of the genes for pyochelin and ferripyochelin receptors